MGHRTSLSLLAGLALTLSTSGCGRPAASPAPEPPPGASAQPGPGNEPAGTPPAELPAPEQPPAALPAPEQPPTALPASGLEGVPGWLGFAVQPEDHRTRFWTPAHPDASAVILDADAWSETVEEGARFRLVAREGNLPLTLSGVSQIPYGCDRNHRTMAAFRTPHELAEQLVWILPEGTPGGHETAAVVPVTAGPKSKRKRSFTVGPLAITLRLDGKHKGRIEARQAGAVLLAQPFEKHEMQGADMDPLDLTQDLEIGVPYPEAAFRIDPSLTLVVLRRMGYEGVSFDVLALRDELQSAGTVDVYLCAF
jgi:hypothetical protein